MKITFELYQSFIKTSLAHKTKGYSSSTLYVITKDMKGIGYILSFRENIPSVSMEDEGVYSYFLFNTLEEALTAYNK